MYDVFRGGFFEAKRLYCVETEVETVFVGIKYEHAERCAITDADLFTDMFIIIMLFDFVS